MRITAQELLDMGDIGPCELIRGELIMMSPAGGKHGSIALEIGRLLGNYVKEHGLGIVCTAETGFLIARNPDTVRAPDVAFVAKERIPPEGIPSTYWPFAPDLAVEVVSPNDHWSEVEEKVEEWLRAGTRMIWVVNPQTQTIHVYCPPKDVRLFLDQDILSGENVLPGFTVPVADIFA
ncbi:MAG: Uma2 family endonuclease [Candidatus Latescibacteria bacterium]|nr:Uma2 family endonuclease [Candidatus Latescibacterota bacterium]